MGEERILEARLYSALRERSIPAATLIAASELIELEEGHAVFRFASEGSFHAYVMNVDRNLMLVKEALAEVLGGDPYDYKVAFIVASRNE